MPKHNSNVKCNLPKHTIFIINKRYFKVLIVSTLQIQIQIKQNNLETIFNLKTAIYKFKMKIIINLVGLLKKKLHLCEPKNRGVEKKYKQ